MFKVFKEDVYDGTHHKYTIRETKEISAVASKDATIDSPHIVNSHMLIEGMIERFIQETRAIKHIDRLRHLEHKLLSLIIDREIIKDIEGVFTEIYNLNEEHDKSYEIVSVH
jgi:hypothetical protein